MAIKKIGVLTSGGDCSGLNTAIGAVVKRANYKYGWEVYGIIEGTVGLMERPLQYKKLEAKDFTIDLMAKGGTMLGTVNKGEPFNFPLPDGSHVDRSQEIVDGFRELGLDALIAIGGDGSMRIIEKLTSLGNINFIGIPKTIDNDVAFTDFAIGYNTALETTTDVVQKIHDTAFSHRRTLIVETMGREAGHIALNSGIAGLADVILIPEIPYALENVVKKIEEAHKEKGYAVVVCSEAVSEKGGDQAYVENVDNNKRFSGAGAKLMHQLEGKLPYETRLTVLGHLQRGGSPVAFDRVLACSFGVRAVDMLAEGKNAKLVVLNGNKLEEVDMKEVVKVYGGVDINSDSVKTARGLGICLGDE